MNKILIIALLFLCSCADHQCWCEKDLDAEWFRLVDLREMLTVISEESSDSMMRIQCKASADSLKICIDQVEHMKNNLPR